MTEQTTREGRCPEVFTNPGGYAIDELRKGDRCELDAGHDGLHAFVLSDGMFQWRTPDPTPEQTTEERGDERLREALRRIASETWDAQYDHGASVPIGVVSGWHHQARTALAEERSGE